MNNLFRKNYNLLRKYNYNISNLRTISTLIPWKKQKNLKQKLIVSANGSFLYTKDEKIIDFTAGAMVVNLGHNNKYIHKAFNNHKERGIAYVPSNFNNYERDKLSERLLSIANMENGKVLFCNAGADANEMASFISKEYHNYTNSDLKKNRVLSFEKSFHGGSTIAASLLSGDKRRIQKEKYYKLNFEPILQNPKLEDNGKESVINIEKIINKNNNISSLLLEGSSGSAGCILYPDNYLKTLKEKCDEKNILIICDEVMSGFGRTGTFFAHFKQDIKPDIITVAKALTCGYIQLGAVLISEKVANVFDNNPIMCGLTYSGHPLACNVANNCLDLYLENDSSIIKNVEYKSNILKENASKISHKYDYIKAFRNNGLLGCFELELNDIQLEEFSELLLNNGIYCMRIRNNIFTAPPLNICDKDLEDTLFKMNNVFEIYNEQL